MDSLDSQTVEPTGNDQQLQGQSRTRLLGKFLENALVKDYNVTTAFVEKLVWPTLILILSLVFQSDVSNFVGQLSNSLSKAGSLKVDLTAVKFQMDALKRSDSEVLKLIQEIDRNDILLLLALGRKKLQGSPKRQAKFQNLINSGLAYVKTLDTATPIIEIGLTEIGERVYEEMEVILVNFVQGLPKDEQ